MLPSLPPIRKSLVWLRRDLRTFDHAALYHALEQSEAVFCVFVFDKEILAPMTVGSNSSISASLNSTPNYASSAAG
jgi:deoxyribodipyrimidine photolyase